jgi:RNA polymerase sigma-70 factor (ECF subfamily)
VIDRDRQFQDLRPLLFSLAYRMLGSRADAEDLVQDAWLRWRSAGEEEVHSPKAYLTTVIARLALDSLKSAYRKRETYVGTWLPEPLIEPAGTQPVEMAESLSLAFMHVLESLSPAERVAFLLREAFDAGYDEIAAALDTSEANSRQLVTRARRHLQERRPRYTVDPGRHEDTLRRFLQACVSGDPSSLTAMLSDDVVVFSDGGGKVPSALNPIAGADRASRLFAGLAKKGAAGARVELAQVNGETGAVLFVGDTIFSVVAIDLDEDGRIRAVFLVNNPEKLTKGSMART